MLKLSAPDVAAPGRRARLGQLCHRSGLLRLLQGARGWMYRDLRVLAYHRVLAVDEARFDFDLDLVSTSPERFREQMLWLKRRFRPMALGRIVAAMEAGERLPANVVAVTFDDGYEDNHRHAFPILRELGIPATFFVSTGHIDSGRPYAYDWLVHMLLRTPADTLVIPELALDQALPTARAARRQLAKQLLDRLKTLQSAQQAAVIARLEQAWQMPASAGHPDCRPMSWAQLREMHAAGFEIGSHGVHHRMLATLPQAELEAELADSKARLESALGAPTPLIAYPVGGDGAFDARVIAATRAAGYRAACCYICGSNPLRRANRYALQRLPVEREMDAAWFMAMLTLPELMSYPSTTRLP